MPTAETFILQKLPEATLKNTIKPKFQLPFGLLESQSCKSDTKRNKTDYNRQIYLSRATKTNQLIRVEMDLHFKTASLPNSLRNVRQMCYHFLQDSGKVDRSEHDLYSLISCQLFKHCCLQITFIVKNDFLLVYLL